MYQYSISNICRIYLIQISYDINYMWNPKKKKKRLTDIENKLKVTKGEKMGKG